VYAQVTVAPLSTVMVAGMMTHAPNVPLACSHCWVPKLQMATPTLPMSRSSVAVPDMVITLVVKT
jgi:hypothetical protein